MAKVYSAEEVMKHNHEKDLWIVYKDGVYDITKFVEEHPGGEEVLINLAGQDATECFDEIGHSGEAIQLRETYKIGTVDGVIPRPSIPSGGTQSEKTTKAEARKQPKRSSTQMWPIALVAILLAIYAHLFH